MDLTYNRLKFYFAGSALEVVNPHIPGRPHEVVIRRVESLGARRCLEICGGSGYGARLLARALPNAEISSLDLSPESIAFGRRALEKSPRSNVELIEGDASSLPFPNDHFDVVFSVLGVHEMPSAVRQRALREAFRVLRPGGRLIVADLDDHTSFPRAFGLYMRLVEPSYALDVLGHGLEDLVVRAGFEVVEHRPGLGSVLPFQLLDARKA